MPNWCENELTIEGKKQDIERFKDKAKDEEGYESFWSDPLQISMSKNKTNILQLVRIYLENHPDIITLLQQLIELQ